MAAMPHASAAMHDDPPAMRVSRPAAPDVTPSTTSPAMPMRFFLLLALVFPLALLAGCDCAPPEEPTRDMEQPAEADAAAAEGEDASAEGEGVDAAPGDADSEGAGGALADEAARSADGDSAAALPGEARGRVQPSYRVQSHGDNLRLQRAEGAGDTSMPSLSLRQYEERTQRREQQLAPPRLDFDPSTLQLRPEIADQLERARQAE